MIALIFFFLGLGIGLLFGLMWEDIVREFQIARGQRYRRRIERRYRNRNPW